MKYDKVINFLNNISTFFKVYGHHPKSLAITDGDLVDYVIERRDFFEVLSIKVNFYQKGSVTPKRLA